MVGTHHGDIYKRRNRAKQIIKLMYVTTFLGRKGKIPIMKENSLSWKKNPYHERKIPDMKEKSLSWKGFVTLIFICREWKFLHISMELILLRFKVFSMEIVWKNIFEKIKKNICTLNWFSARANFLLKWFNTGFYQYCIF